MSMILLMMLYQGEIGVITINYLKQLNITEEQIAKLNSFYIPF